MIGRRFSNARRWGATLLALALLPGWILPPECAACPHASRDDAPSEVHAHQDASDVHGHHGHGLRQLAPEHAPPPPAEDEPDHESHDDCGCPCDVQCAAPGMPASDEASESQADDAEVHVERIEATSLRDADAPHPPFFIPFSNAPPR